jgi:hypothetical protein
MTTTYKYGTLANFEKHAVKDYSAIDAALTDTIVEWKMSDAETYINGYVGTTFTGTIPADITLCTFMIAKIFMDNYMIEEKIGSFAQSNEIITDVLSRFDIVAILEKYKNLYTQTRGVFVSKNKHVPPTSYREMRRPTGW